MPLLEFGQRKWQKDFVQVFTIECISKWTLSQRVHHVNWPLVDEENGMEKMQKCGSTMHI
jgi:hypothetical protein